MNNATLKHANERLGEVSNKIMILESGANIAFTELDFYNGGDNSGHVWLYINRNAIACIDMRSVSGLIAHPWPFIKDEK